MGGLGWYRIAISPAITGHNEKAGFLKVREVIFIKSLLKNMLADTRRLKYTGVLNFGFIMSGFCMTADRRRSQTKMNQ